MVNVSQVQRGFVKFVDNEIAVAFEGWHKAVVAGAAGLLAANMDQAEVMKVFMGLSDGELTRLENVYGKKPVNKYSSLSMLLSAYATKDTFTQRSNALKEMLTTNPFAVQRFKDMVMEDVWAPEPILLWYIYDDLLLPENSDLTCREPASRTPAKSSARSFSVFFRWYRISCLPAFRDGYRICRSFLTPSSPGRLRIFPFCRRRARYSTSFRYSHTAILRKGLMYKGGGSLVS